MESPDFYRWEAPGKNVSIFLRLDVIDRLLPEIMRAFGAVPRRGAETGGILLGAAESWDPLVVRVLDFELAPVSYSRGPSYLFSAQELEAFEELLLKHRHAAGRTAYPVGWFRSHTREGLGLSPEDLDFFNRFFPAPSDVALLIRPFVSKPCAAGFFFREGAEIRTESSYLEIPFRRDKPAPKAARRPAPPVAPPIPPAPPPVFAGTRAAALGPQRQVKVMSDAEIRAIVKGRPPWRVELEKLTTKILRPALVALPAGVGVLILLWGAYAISRWSMRGPPFSADTALRYIFDRTSSLHPTRVVDILDSRRTAAKSLATWAEMQRPDSWRTGLIRVRVAATIRAKPQNVPELSDSEPATQETVVIIRPPTGALARPSGPFGVGQLSITNRSGLDASGKLVARGAEFRPLRYVYIRSGESLTIRDIPLGVYFLRADFGTDWLPDRSTFRTNRREAERIGPLSFLEILDSKQVRSDAYRIDLEPPGP